jgi:CRISPR-associated exonuclease Cas4
MREGEYSAAANMETVLESARRYAVKGLKRFVRDLSRDWRLGGEAASTRKATPSS